MSQEIARQYFAEQGIRKGGLSKQFRRTAFPGGEQPEVSQDLLDRPHELARADDERALAAGQRSDGDNEWVVGGGQMARGGLVRAKARANLDVKNSKKTAEWLKLIDRISKDLERLQELYKQLARLDEEIAELEIQQAEALEESQEAFGLAEEETDILEAINNGKATPEQLKRARELLGDKAHGKSDEEVKALLAADIQARLEAGRLAAEEAERLRVLAEERKRRRAEVQREADALEERLKARAAAAGIPPKSLEEAIQERKDTAREIVKENVVAATKVAVTSDDPQLKSAVATHEQEVSEASLDAISDDEFVLPPTPSAGPT